MLDGKVVDLERAVIGGILTDPSVAEVAFNLLTEGDLYMDSSRKIFSLARKIYERDGVVDLALLRQEAKKDPSLDKLCKDGFLLKLMDSAVMGSGFAEVYCRRIKESARLRKVVSYLDRIRPEFEAAGDPQPLLEAIYELLTEEDGKITSLPREEIASRLKETIVARVEHPDAVGGVPTGWRDLDLLLDGLNPGRLYLIAGRPSMGKSSFMISMARNMAQRGIKVGIFSLEMSAFQIYEWMVSQRARVNIRKPSKKDVPALLKAVDEVMELPVWIDDENVWMGRIRQKARLWCKEGVEVIFLDHILLVEDRAKDPYQKVSEVSRKLKKMAKDLNVPVVALCQLSRKVEDRGGEHRPRLSDLRDSGKLEENADVVIFIHRPGYYGIEPNGKPKNYAAVIVEKQRDGALGTVDFVFIEDQRRFELLTKER